MPTIKFNGKSTYMVVGTDGTCLFATDSERKAKNFLKRFLRDAGVEV
jgi:hypothetical protein